MEKCSSTPLPRDAGPVRVLKRSQRQARRPSQRPHSLHGSRCYDHGEYERPYADERPYQDEWPYQDQWPYEDERPYADERLYEDGAPVGAGWQEWPPHRFSWLQAHALCPTLGRFQL